uniref:RNA polymerase sigma factor n=1 Tax=Aegilops tauschii subsp. strangulata TaxID=200361 RepID=A0A453I0M4_AEGTS
MITLPLSEETKQIPESIRAVALSLHLRPPASSLPRRSPTRGELSISPGCTMACLAPHFKWAPSSFSTTHAYQHPSSSSSSSNSGRCSGRRPFRVQCAVTSAAAAVVDADHAAGGPLHLVYSSPDSAPVLQRNFESTLASETVLNKEAVVTAAAAEAVALARAAAEAAQEVVHMVQKSSSQPVFRKKGEVENYLAKEILRTEMLSSRANEYSDGEPYGIPSDEAELDDDTQDADNIAVKSARQSERRARRTRATMKAATIVRSSPKLAASSKKKRSKGPSTMNPLGSLWKMTGRKLLTAKEEVELSNGIQDLLKLEAIQGELAEYNGGQPTFPQWAAAAGTDENTLRKRLDHGIHCKNRMVTSNVRLVISIAREFEGPGLELYDLIQVHGLFFSCCG